MTTSDAIRVLVCDPQPLVCEGLRAILDREPDITVVRAVTSPGAALAEIPRWNPSVVVIGDEPAFDAINLAKVISHRGPGMGGSQGGVPTLLVLDCEEIRGSLARALRAGVRGLLCKDGAQQRLGAAVREVAAGTLVVAQPAAGHLVTQLSPLAVLESKQPVGDSLSVRELEVFQLVAKGLTNREIAHKLALSVATVKSHLYSICRKLNLRDRVQVVIFAYESGLVRPNGNYPSFDSTVPST